MAKAGKWISESQEKFARKPIDKALEMWDTTSTVNERTKQTEVTLECGNHRKVTKTYKSSTGTTLTIEEWKAEQQQSVNDISSCHKNSSVLSQREQRANLRTSQAKQQCNLAWIATQQTLTFFL